MKFGFIPAVALAMAVASPVLAQQVVDTSNVDKAMLSSEKTYHIATVVKVDGIAWFDRMRDGVKQFGDDTGSATWMVGPAPADAAAQVQSFLLNAHRHNFRTVLITHGKGVHSAKPGVMKSYVMHWLRESELVLAWHSAPTKQGGTGATYVLVRKSGDARKENREQFKRGGK